MYFAKRRPLSDQTQHTLVFYDTLQHCFGSPDRPSSGRYQIHKKDIKGERPLCTAVQIITILLQKQNNKVKLNVKCGTEFLRYIQFETVCNCHLYVVHSPICCLYSHTELLLILYMTAVDHTNCL